ncbi:VWR domain protein in aerotolerance operon BatA [Thalassotalea loyana]|uniref:VWR domain protein in aerotolerance operon BatA n=1 Tax=Thalassotalea loyana TaxID=280483 RepID=A0ABQ6HJ02_9GAMM|nr:VWA domain-containing protein [Thalassotalea loyana]GLX86676.1 VWR domain protein in aerotolerance operon BatA [Thalassotalea loyana]
MFSFEWPWALSLIILPLLVYWLPSQSKSQQSALKVPIKLDGLTSHTHKTTRSTGSLLLLTLIWLLLVFSAARPQWLGEPINIPNQSREMMIAVDLSGSMQIEDMSLHGANVNRLDMLKEVLGDFIQRRIGDRLGLILFADDAYMQTPMTFDRATVAQMLDEAVIGLVGKKTAIGDAMALAVKRFNQKDESNRVLLLVTDGQNTAGKITPEQALELAVAQNVTIYTIGIGADEMLQRTIFGTRKVNPSAELDEKSLKNIAQQTGGQYFRARDSQSMNEIYRQLDNLEPVEQEQQQMRPRTALFFYSLSLALAIAAIALLVKVLPTSLRQKQELDHG